MKVTHTLPLSGDLELLEMQRRLHTCADGPAPSAGFVLSKVDLQALPDGPADQRAAAGKYRRIPYLMKFRPSRSRQLLHPAVGRIDDMRLAEKDHE